MRARIAARVRRDDYVGALGLMGHERRLDAVFRWYFAGRGPLREALADAWNSAELPGSSDPALLDLWIAVAAGSRIEDDAPVPSGDPLTIYR